MSYLIENNLMVLTFFLLLIAIFLLFIPYCLQSSKKLISYDGFCQMVNSESESSDFKVISRGLGVCKEELDRDNLIDCLNIAMTEDRLSKSRFELISSSFIGDDNYIRITNGWNQYVEIRCND